MKIEEEIIDRLKELTKTPMIVFPATVDQVDKTKLSCTVSPLEGPALLNVSLKAGVENPTDGMVEIPSEGSIVLVGIIGNEKRNAFVAKCAEVDEVMFYGGENGGLIKVNELISQLEKVNTFLQQIRAGFTEWIPAQPDGTSLKSLMSGKLGGLTTADYSSIENTKIKH